MDFKRSRTISVFLFPREENGRSRPEVGAFEIALASMPTLRPQQQGAIEIDWSQLIGSAGTAAAKRTKGGEVQLSKGTILVGGCAFVFAALALPSVAAFLSRLACASAALTRLCRCCVFTSLCHCYVITPCCCPRTFRCTHTCTPVSSQTEAVVTAAAGRRPRHNTHRGRQFKP